MNVRGLDVVKCSPGHLKSAYITYEDIEERGELHQLKQVGVWHDFFVDYKRRAMPRGI